MNEIVHTNQIDGSRVAEHPRRATHPASCDIDFPVVLGQAFDRLPANVQARFASHCSSPARPVIYTGTMQTMHATPLGRLLALAARLIGNPVVASNEAGVTCAVTLTPDLGQGGTVWHRAYDLSSGVRIAATTKRTGTNGAPVEQFCRWAGMELDIAEQNGELHFLTTRYFAEWHGRRIYLPRILSPGRLLIVHRDEGGGHFRFILTLTHPLIGVLIHQDGLFSDPEDLS